MLDHVNRVESILVDFKILLYLTDFDVFNLIEHVDEARVGYLAVSTFVELISLCLQSLFVRKVENRLKGFAATLIKLDGANKISLFIIANVLIFLLLAEEVES